MSEPPPSPTDLSSEPIPGTAPPGPVPEAAPPGPVLPLLGTTLVYLLLFHLITATRFMPYLSHWGNNRAMAAAGAFLSLVPLTLLQLLLVRYLTEWRAPAGMRLGILLVSVLAWLAFLALAGSVQGPPGMVLEMFLNPWSNLALIASTVLLGAFISLAVKDAALMLPVLLVGGLVDYWGVYYGTTHHFVKNAPQIVERVSAKVPTVSFGGVPVVTTIGPGDFLFLGLFFACMVRFGFDIGRTFWAFFALLLISLMIVAAFPIPIPALVPMAVAMLGVNWRKLRMSRAEAFATLYAMLFLVALLVGSVALGVFKR